MATSPKIRFDIEANASGAAQVEKLATELEKLDGAIDPALAQKARDAAAALRSIGQQQDAISEFVKWKNATGEARAELERAQAAAQKLATEIAQSGQPTRAQAGQMEKLRDAVREAKQELTSQTAGLDAARSALQQMGIPLDGVAAKQRALRQSTEQLRQELQAVAQTASGASTFGTLVRDTDAARAKMEALAKAADLYAGSLGKSGPPTAAQATNLRTMQDAAAAARAEFERLQAETVQQATALRQAGVNTEQLAAKARELAGAERQAGAAAQQFGAQSVAAAGQAVRANNEVRDSVERIGGGLRSVAAAAAAVVGGGLLAGEIGNVLRTADAYNNLAARIRITTGEGAAFERAFEGVFDVAKRTSSAIESTGTLFTQISRAGKELNISQRDALALTETINQAVQVSGASAESSDAALQQLIQGLQSGVLRGEEFNSVMEQAPRLAIALADGLGVTTGELRKQAEAGALTSQVVIQALQGQAAVVANEFNQLPPTVGRALTNLSTEWTRYVGEVDKANGVSAAAASAINSLAGNLDTLGAVLFSAGKAAAAYTAVRLAATFLANAQAATAAAAAKTQETAATAANSAAQAANTTATTANTAAKRANAAAATAAGAAADGAVAGAGRLATILATLRTFTLIGIITNFREIGTWLGESVAKWQGYGKAIEDAESKAKALDQAQREMAAQDAAIAQARQRATDAMNGMTAAAKVLVGAHDDVIKSGGTAAEALAKLASAANVSDTTGIKTVSAALDSLATNGENASKRVAQTQQALNAALTAGGANMEANVQSAIGQLERLGPTGVAAADQLRGAFAEALQSGDFSNFGTMSKAVFDSISLRAAITSTQIRETLAAALKDEDLLRFETNARAAFDGSEQGARRLAAAIDAVGIEALRRAGTSVEELETGFSKAMTRAANDVDMLARELVRLQAPIEQSGKLLSASLDKSLEAANTEQAINRVIEKTHELRDQNLITEEQWIDGLKRADEKMEAMLPGINNIQEALKNFGLKTKEEIQDSADKLKEGWDLISNSIDVSIKNKVKAFEQYKAAAIEANNGVVPSQIIVEEAILRTKVAAAKASAGMTDLGDAGVDAGTRTAESFQTAEQIMDRVSRKAQTGSGADGGEAGQIGDRGESTDNSREKRLAGQSVGDASGFFRLQEKISAGTLTLADETLVNAVAESAKQNAMVSRGVPAGALSFDFWRSLEAQTAVSQRALEAIASMKDQEVQAERRKQAEAAAEAAREKAEPTAQPSQKAPTISSTSTPSAARTVNVNLTLGGRSVTIPTTESGAESLISVLEQAKAALGG